MIIARVTGGLGNQMFQYAAAKALAIQNGIDVKLDISEYLKDQLRNFDLFNLNVTASIASKNEIDQVKAFNSFGRIKSKLTSYKKRRFYKQPFFHFDDNFFNLGANVYIQGYFQSEKYFHSIKEIIINDFTLKKEVIGKVRELGTSLQNENSVSVHIRKGDYKNKETQKVHGVLPLDYYDQALKKIRSEIQNPHFYIFTDDSKWVEQNFKVSNATIISNHISFNHFEDLFLMSHCCHNIIANSSFSWWGAWLNQNKEKIVIAPENWFNKGPKDVHDLIPANWTKL
jgi:hypothetical protein